MKKLILTAFLFICSISVSAQNYILVLKKRGLNIQYFSKDSYISFQLKNREWVKGIITKMTSDSIYLKKEVIRFSLLGSDTAHFSGFGFPIKEIFAFPKKGVQLHYINGSYQINKSAGHIHWYWIKSGWVFRVGAAGYAALNILNGLRDKPFSLSGSNLGIAAGIFSGGALLKKSYRHILPLGKKYHLETINIAD
jgi:hypothetical protein